MSAVAAAYLVRRGDLSRRLRGTLIKTRVQAVCELLEPSVVLLVYFIPQDRIIVC